MTTAVRLRSVQLDVPADRYEADHPEAAADELRFCLVPDRHGDAT